MLHCNNRYVMPVPTDEFREGWPRVAHDLPKIKVQPVDGTFKSRLIKAFGYDPNDQQLLIIDHRGHSWQFYRVKPDDYRELCAHPEPDYYFTQVLQKRFPTIHTR